MSKVDSVTLQDAANNKYEFGVYTPDTDWADIGTVYGFLKKNAGNSYHILYIGKAASMCNRQDDHERWKEATRKGANHIMACVIKDERTRQAVEKALISFYQPEMNTQYTKQETAGRSGLYR
ncbi:MAG: hypothetical protein WC464_05055 [Bdellovibrionales bacterium]